jgi:L-malate glycosyltransferase
MKSSRVFVLPSTREGFGISALEALATGLPIVTVDHPKNASRAFVGDGCGALAALDAHDVAEKIQEVLERKEPLENCKTAREYDWDSITNTIEEYYRMVKERS